MAKKPDFNLDLEVLKDEHNFGSISMCWYCTNRHRCPLPWNCDTLANMDNDDSDNGVDEA